MRSDLVTPTGECGAASLPLVENINGLPANRFVVAGGAQLLRGGIGQTTGAPQGAGEMQVEYYCQDSGYDIREDGTNWYCTSGGRDVIVFSIEIFDEICEDTYGLTDAFALQTGSGTAPAFRWRCYAR